MFGLSFTEVLLILAIALVVLGPDRLPGLAKALGRATREFRKATREIRATLEVEEVRRTLRERIDIERETSRVVKPAPPATPDDLADKKKQLSEAPAPSVPGAIEATSGPGTAPPSPEPNVSKGNIDDGAGTKQG